MLIVHAPDSYHARYSHYLAAILRGEGYADLEHAVQQELSDDLLAAHDLVLLPRLVLPFAQIDILTTYVHNGGVLIAFQPDYQLTRRFGVEPTFAGTVAPRLRINTDDRALAGLSDAAIDVVVPAVHWRLPAADANGPETRILATLDTDDRPPAVVSRAFPQATGAPGAAIFFAYDLPHAIARLRQGNPENADLGLADCDDANRGNELFVGQLDPSQLHLPQADIHSALLGRIIDAWAPRPRLWYYSTAAQRSVQVMTSDEDWSTLEQWESLIAGLQQRNATCTFFMVDRSRVDKRDVARWEEAGHVFSVHPAHPSDYQRDLPKPSHHRLFMAQMLRDNILRHQAEYKRPVHTIRQHRVRWFGYVECAQVQAELGVRMDCNFLSVKPYHIGYMSGSGRALPFVDTDGTLVPGYQMPAQWTEETLIHESMSFSLRWPAAKAAEVACGLVREAAQQFYTPICFNSHPVSYHTYSSPLVDAAWDQAVALDVPIVSADHWLAWSEARDGVRLERTPNGYTLHASKAVATLTLLLPAGLDGASNGGATNTVTLWATDYTAIRLDNLSAGATVTLDVHRSQEHPA